MYKYLLLIFCVTTALAGEASHLVLQFMDDRFSIRPLAEVGNIAMDGEQITVQGTTYHLSTVRKITFRSLPVAVSRKTKVEGGPARPRISPDGSRLTFQFKKPCRFKVQILDIRGKMLRPLWEGAVPAGRFEIPWPQSAKGFPDGPSGPKLLMYSVDSRYHLLPLAALAVLDKGAAE